MNNLLDRQCKLSILSITYVYNQATSPAHRTMKTESSNKALEGTHDGDIVGGSCGPGEAFRRFCCFGEEVKRLYGSRKCLDGKTPEPHPAVDDSGAWKSAHNQFIRF
jgi:hypothetical protein